MSTELPFRLNGAGIRDLVVHVHARYSRPRAIHPYVLGEDCTRVPFHYGRLKGYKPRGAFARVPFQFTGQLRAEQADIIRRAFELLRAHQCLVLATHVGFGKTILALYIASQVRLKTLIVVDMLELMDQWRRAAARFLAGARVCVVDAAARAVDPDNDVFIVNLINLPKFPQLRDLGLVIADEVHGLLSETLCAHLLYCAPKYLVGLSATPCRADESQQLFDLFFDPRAILFKPLLKPHTVYKVLTGVPIELPRRGDRVDWNAVIDQQSASPERAQLVARIVATRPDLTFLVLCKRVAQIETIAGALAAAGVSVEAVHGARRVDYSARPRVLVGTFKKLGKGFDRADFNALVLAADVERYFIQALGRVFRDPRVEPVIFDLVDDNPILEKHFQTRAQVYLSAGGTIENKRFI